MLKQRVITAVVLLAILLPALFYPQPEPFCAVTLVLIGAGGWEWAKLNGYSFTFGIGTGLVLAAVLAWLWLGLGFGQAWAPLWQTSYLVWLLLAVFLLKRGVGGWAPIPKALRLTVGLVLIGLAWWAVASALHAGVGMLLSILTLVWMADIAAYFGGKALGRRKLAVTISPGKSWEGAFSGFAGVLLLAAFWLWATGPEAGNNLYSKLWLQGPVLGLLGLVGLSVMSVVGDLLESLVKRSAGVKDSSQLLPGHGGVLDRVDALLPVLPMAMMWVTL
jgi:phosphatidate cytidylyltransferase